MCINNNKNTTTTKCIQMESSATVKSGRAQIVPKKCSTMFPAMKHPSSRRSPSFSSSSSLSSSSSSSLQSSSNPEDSPVSRPATPARFSGVPFSWEHFPGIPKKPNNNNNNSNNKKDSSTLKLLPLPPQQKPKKYISSDDIRVRNSSNKQTDSPRDPFFAALVECSKDDDDDDGDDTKFSKVSRSVSDRFGFVNLYTSCKSTCAVSESIVSRPRPRRTSYHRINYRSISKTFM